MQINCMIKEEEKTKKTQLNNSGINMIKVYNFKKKVITNLHNDYTN